MKYIFKQFFSGVSVILMMVLILNSGSVHSIGAFASPTINEFHSGNSSNSNNIPNPDWVELFNYTRYTFNLSNWYLEDSDGNSVALSGTMGPKSYKIVNFANRLTNGGDTITLRSDGGSIADSVAYGDEINAIVPAPAMGKTAAYFGSTPSWRIGFPTKSDFNHRPVNESIYAFPDSNAVYRSSDEQVRIFMWDPFSYATRIEISVNGTVHTLDRTECASKYAEELLCSMSTLDSWDPSPGVYTVSTKSYDQYNNIFTELPPRTFTIDDTKPVINSLTATEDQNEVVVTATANDNVKMDSVNFFVTNIDHTGKCSANQTILNSKRVYESLGNSYTVSFNNTELSSGSYCVFAAARDSAMNNSNPNVSKVPFVLQ